MGTIVLAWFLGSIAVGIIAAVKGRSFFASLLISLILSPLIGLIVVLVSKSGDQLERDAARNGSSSVYRVCPKCAETIRREAEICRYCQFDLTNDPPPPTFWESVGRGVRDLLR